MPQHFCLFSSSFIGSQADGQVRTGIFCPGLTPASRLTNPTTAVTTVLQYQDLVATPEMPPHSLLDHPSHPNQCQNPPEPNHRQIANPGATSPCPISKLPCIGSIIVMNPASKQPSRKHSQSGKVQHSIYTPASCRCIDRNSLYYLRCCIGFARQPLALTHSGFRCELH